MGIIREMTENDSTMESDPRILSRLELRSEEVMKRWRVKRAASEAKKRAGRPKKAA